MSSRDSCMCNKALFRMQEHLPDLGAGRVQLTCAERQTQRRKRGVIVVPPVFRTILGTMWGSACSSPYQEWVVWGSVC
jgi:hypothetical protein